MKFINLDNDYKNDFYSLTIFDSFIYFNNSVSLIIGEIIDIIAKATYIRIIPSNAPQTNPPTLSIIFFLITLYHRKYNFGFIYARKFDEIFVSRTVIF